MGWGVRSTIWCMAIKISAFVALKLQINSKYLSKCMKISGNRVYLVLLREVTFVCHTWICRFPCSWAFPTAPLLPSDSVSFHRTLILFFSQPILLVWLKTQQIHSSSDWKHLSKNIGSTPNIIGVTWLIFKKSGEIFIFDSQPSTSFIAFLFVCRLVVYIDLILEIIICSYRSTPIWQFDRFLHKLNKGIQV